MMNLVLKDEQQYYDVLAYISSCAQEIHADPQVNAPLRLLSVLLRLLELVADDPRFDQNFLKETQQLILDNRVLLLNDGDKFGSFLDQLTMRIAAKSLS